MKTIKSVEKSFHILNAIARWNGRKNLTELSALLSLSPGTLHGFLATLEEVGAIARDPLSGKYVLGPLILKYSLIGNPVQSLAQACQPCLDRLRDTTRETVHLAIPEPEGKILYIAKAESPYPYRLTSLVGTAEPAASSALGYLLYSLELDPKDETIRKNMETSRPCCVKYEKELDAYCLAASFTYGNAPLRQAGLSIVIPHQRWTAHSQKFYQEALLTETQQLESWLRKMA